MFLNKINALKKYKDIKYKLKRLNRLNNTKYIMSRVKSVFDVINFYYDFVFNDEKLNKNKEGLYNCAITLELNGEQYLYFSYALKQLFNHNFEDVFKNKIIYISETIDKDINFDDFIPTTNTKLNVAYTSIFKLFFKKVEKEISKDNIKIINDKLKEIIIKKYNDETIYLVVNIIGLAKKENDSNN